MTPEDAYEKLCQRMKEAALLGSVGSALAWDQETYMPKKASAYRAEQLAYFSGQTHRLTTSPEAGDWIKTCEDGLDDSGARQANVREWRRDYDRDTKLPVELVEEMTRTESQGREVWVEARRKADFSLFLPVFRKLVELQRKKADYFGWEESPYDALLDVYEPGARASALAPLFAELGGDLAARLPAWREGTAAFDRERMAGNYPLGEQQKFNREVAAAFGFDFEAGRVDTTTHPFCTRLGPSDHRITTRYDERQFTDSLYSVLHEVGHGLYEQGLPEDAYGTPLGQAASLGIHESQSRLWENQIGRAEIFWNHWHARACHHFPGLRRLAPEEMGRLVNRVEPSFIRVESDEATYNLHIILRFEIERPLIEGHLDPGDVPGQWNRRFHELFGIEVPDDARGCLQDIHWSMGLFAYFPTYTLGNLNAAQLFHAAGCQIPALANDLADGNYRELLGWLRDKIHSQGRRHLPGELMRRATGEPTQAKYFLDYLAAKFDVFSG
jgi:carboxypeptidase Taq